MTIMLLDAIATVLSLAILQSFNWALRGHFKSDKMPAGMKVIMIASVITGLVYLTLMWTREQPPSAQIAGMAIELCAVVLFAAVVVATRRFRFRMAFDDSVPDELVTSGPYRYIRHPFYTSYLIFWTGFAVITCSWLSLPFLFLLGAIYFWAARGEDLKFAATAMADQHSRYRQQAGMFWPKLPYR